VPSETERILLFAQGQGADVPAARFGNKAANLARMASLGLPVPPGFALGVELCREYYRRGRRLPEDLSALLEEGIAFLQRMTGLEFGSRRNPLLVSVRSGSAVSMPGMMTTVLNVGLNRDTVQGLILRRGNPRFAWDSYRRLLENFAEVVGAEPGALSAAVRTAMTSAGAQDQAELDFRSLRELAGAYERVLKQRTGQPFPADPRAQLTAASRAILESWTSRRARAFRLTNGLDDSAGTAITVQAMVYGNLGPDSGAGVMFSRNPWTGEDRPLIDFKRGVQGEDVVSQSRTSRRNHLATLFPDLHRELLAAGRRLEIAFGDMQDVEFTIEGRKLYLLQTRSGAREPLAALRIALDLLHEGVVDRDTALGRIGRLDLEAIATSEIVEATDPIAHGEAASLGVASGALAFSTESVTEMASRGPVILVREDLSTDDLRTLQIAAGALLPHGSRTSHAIVVARQMGKVVVVHCPEITIDAGGRRLVASGRELIEGDTVTIDGATGRVYAGTVRFVTRPPTELLDAVRGLRAAAT
jgi:pyruvate, orthophosphate dikinase